MLTRLRHGFFTAYISGALRLTNMSALLTSELSTEGLISGIVETAFYVHGKASAYEAGIHYFQRKDDRSRHCTAILVRAH